MAADLFGPALITTGNVATAATTVRPADDRVVGGADTWFRDCTSETEDDGTAFRAYWMNLIMALLRTLARGNGMRTDGATPVLPDTNADAQILTSLQHMMQRGLASRAVDTGVKNNLVLVLTPVPVEILDGFTVAGRARYTNDGPANLTVGPMTAPVVLRGGAVLTGGEIIADDWHVFRFNQDRDAWQIIGPSPNATVDQTIWHEGSLAGSGAAFTATLSPQVKADAYGINIRLTVGNVTNAANATLDFGFGPKPLVINSTNQPVAGGEFVPSAAHTIDIFYDGTRCRLMNPAPAPVTVADNFAPFNFPAAQNLGNNTTTTISLAGFVAPWGSGDQSGFTFTQPGIYTIDFLIVLQVTTTRNDLTGGSAATARFYTSVNVYKNNNIITPNNQAGSASNYQGVSTMSDSYTSVFVAGDKISITGLGSGDSYQSGGCSLVAPSFVNISLLRR